VELGRAAEAGVGWGQGLGRPSVGTFGRTADFVAECARPGADHYRPSAGGCWPTVVSSPSTAGGFRVVFPPFKHVSASLLSGLVHTTKVACIVGTLHWWLAE
jgi:hypothetical protein